MADLYPDEEDTDRKGMPREHLDKLQEEFLALDQDGDGDISLKEMKVLLKSLKTKLRMSETEINKLLRTFDQNGDGTIDVKEFMAIIESGSKKDIIQKALIQR